MRASGRTRNPKPSIERSSALGSWGRIEAAIRWAVDQETVDWLDSEIFGHNEPALNLHRRLGFTEVGRMIDMYRIDEASVDDVRLALHLRHS